MYISIQGQIEAFIVLLLFLLFIQITTMITFRHIFGKISASISFPLSLLLFSFFGLYGNYFQIPPECILIPFIVSIVYACYHSGFRSLLICFDNIRVYFLYILSFIFMSVIAAYSMVIGTSENVTDFSILMSLWRNPIIPPHDPWLGGIPMNMYYYMSHLVFAAISRVTGISPDILFTLAIPTIFAATIMGIYSLSVLLLSRYRYLPLLTVFVPNAAFFLFLFSGKTLNDALIMSTRVITGTNNEYPFYSFVMSVFHAHSISLFNQVFLLVVLTFLLIQWKKFDGIHRLSVACIAALSFGAMFPLNTWEVAIYGPGIFLAGYWIFRERSDTDNTPLVVNSTGKNRLLTFIESSPFSSLMVFWILIPLLSLILYLPYHITQRSVYYGLDFIKNPSDPVQFLLLYGPLLLILLFFLQDIIRKKPIFIVIPIIFLILGYPVIGIILMFLCYFMLRREGVLDFMGVLGFWALFLAEFFVYEDRFNTVFKFQYCASIILGFIFWATISNFLQNNRILKERGCRVEQGIQVLFITGAMALSLIIAGSCGHAPSLDALTPLGPHLGSDGDAISFLRSLPGDHVIVEVSDSTIGGYHPYGRISSFTGIPAVVGWWSHEIQWRRLDPQQMALRVKMNNEVYEDPNRTIQYMDKLGADLLYVGTLEEQNYKSINLPKEGLEKIYDKNGAYIFRKIGNISDISG